MAGLNDLITNQTTSSGSLPQWFTTAQQNAVNLGAQAASPAIGDTAATSAINAFGTTGPFATGQESLSKIASGAANPWMVSETGEVTPDTSTPLGGLYKAQTDYLNQIMPSIDTGATAGSIAGGDFGSSMNQGKIAKARADAASQLFQNQMTNALNAQQTGATAGAALGTLGNYLVQNALNTGTYQQNAPYASAINQANILSKMGQQPVTTTSSTQLGGLNQLMGLLSLTNGGIGSLLGGSPVLDAAGKVVTDASGKPVLSTGVLDKLSGIWNKITGTGTSGGTILDIYNNPVDVTSGDYGTGVYSGGYYYDPNTGDYYNTDTGELIYAGGDTGGFDQSFLDSLDASGE